MTSEEKKQTSELIDTVLLLAVEHFNCPFECIGQMRKLKQLPYGELSKRRYDLMWNALRQRMKTLRKRGKIITRTYRGKQIQVWSRNEMGWSYLPIVDNVKLGLPKYALPNELT